jgi:hypothetical protein
MPYRQVNKRVTDLNIGEITWCKHSGKYSGVSIGRDEDGFFALTHRARCSSYPSPAEIPLKKIKWIRSTG